MMLFQPRVRGQANSTHFPPNIGGRKDARGGRNITNFSPRSFAGNSIGFCPPPPSTIQPVASSSSCSSSSPIFYGHLICPVFSPQPAAAAASAPTPLNLPLQPLMQVLISPSSSLAGLPFFYLSLSLPMIRGSLIWLLLKFTVPPISSSLLK